jgi:hypothetical protein
MKITIRDLWHPAGTIDRRTYAVVGVAGFALKHNLDRLVSSYGFHRPWGLFNYWVPLGNIGRITNLRSRDAVFLETLLALSLPFVWIGIVLTLKRLRSAGLPSPLVVLFFVPFLNLLFFLLLCLLPERTAFQIEPKKTATPIFLRLFPEGALGSAALSVLFTVLPGIGIALLGTKLLVNYGWGLFVALPFTMGLAAALIYGARGPRTLNACVSVACLSIGVLGLGLFAFAVEGVICLMMAIPIALPLAAFGGACGYIVQKRRWLHDGTPAFLSVLLIFVPGVQWAEHAAAIPPPTFEVRSSIEVDAPPEKVWQQVIAFSEIPPPTEWMFRAGIAYPIRAEIHGSGPGAERHCVFSTGSFVEPIQVWDQPHKLKFSVTANPPPLEEWTPYAQIDPPHLHGFLVSNGGQFLLTPLPNGRTRLEGTTWYRHSLWPSSYWRYWSDAIIHRIHLRVLNHIRDEAEKGS